MNKCFINKSHKKILIIGIDGGTWTILKPAMDEGYMPYLKSLVKTGASGTLESTIPAITPAAWGSFQTGVNPGKNGAFDFAAWDKRTKQKVYASSRSLRRTIWEAASEGGLRVGVVNVPMTYPPKKVNGYIVSGILTPSLESPLTHPPELKPELLSVIPDYHIFNLGNFFDEYHKQFEKFVEKMVTIVRNRSKAACYIIEKEPLDLLMVHFQANDVLQHRLWAFLDPEHSLYNNKKRHYILERFYRTLDEEIQKVNVEFEKTNRGNYNVIIISDHGFQAHIKCFNLANWLFKEGYLQLDMESFRRPLIKRLVRRLDLFNIRRHLSRRLRSRLATMLKGGRQGDHHNYRWTKSRAFSFGHCTEGFVYLLEDQLTERQETTAILIRKLKEIRDPENGMSPIQAIHRKEEIYSGGFMELMPDLVIEPAKGYSFTGSYQSGEGLFHKVRPGIDPLAGKHHRDGILVAVGKGIKNQSNINAQLIDIAPTILYLLGLPIWESIDGRVVVELFTDEYRNLYPLQEKILLEENYRKNDAIVYSSKDEEAIKKRLRDIGYI